jgi:hypothetical protein
VHPDPVHFLLRWHPDRGVRLQRGLRLRSAVWLRSQLRMRDAAARPLK